MIDGYKITISQTADGLNEYLQIMSLDQNMSVNVVLIAERFELVDDRPGAQDQQDEV